MIRFLDEDGLSDKERAEVDQILFRSAKDENTTCFFLDDPVSVAALHRYEKAHGTHTSTPQTAAPLVVGNVSIAHYLAAAVANAKLHNDAAALAAVMNAMGSGGYNLLPPPPLATAGQTTSPQPTAAFCLPSTATMTSVPSSQWPPPHGAALVYRYAHPAAPATPGHYPFYCPTTIYLPPQELQQSAAALHSLTTTVTSSSSLSVTNSTSALTAVSAAIGANSSGGDDAALRSAPSTPLDACDDVAAAVERDAQPTMTSSESRDDDDAGLTTLDVVPIDPEPNNRASLTLSQYNATQNENSPVLTIKTDVLSEQHQEYDDTDRISQTEEQDEVVCDQKAGLDDGLRDLSIETVERGASELDAAIDVGTDAESTTATLEADFSKSPTLESSPTTMTSAAATNAPAATATSAPSAPRSWASLFKNAPEANKAIVIKKYDPMDVNDVVDDSSTAALSAAASKHSAGPASKVAGNDDFVRLETVDRDPPAQAIGKSLKTHKLEHRGPSFPLRGLKNFGNWCYVNATLQALMSCPPFVHLMRHLKFVEMRTPSSTPMLDALVKFVGEFSSEKISKKSEDKCSSFEPSYVYSALSSLRDDASFKGRQEDAEEFLGVVLNHLHEEIAACMNYWTDQSNVPNGEYNRNTSATVQIPANDDSPEWQQVGPGRKLPITRTSKLAPSPIAEIFSGVLRNAFSQPGTKDSVSLESFFTLQLSVQSNEATLLSQAIQQMSRETIVRRDPSKKIDGEITRRTTFQELPLVLILHLKCFVFADDTVRKRTKQIVYGVDLHIDRSFVVPSSSNAQMQNKMARSYKLFAVVFHHGENAEGGHYTADIFHGGHWVNMDDAKYEIVDESHVLDYRPPRVPYLLFYRRCDVFSDNRNMLQQQQYGFKNY